MGGRLFLLLDLNKKTEIAPHFYTKVKRLNNARKMFPLW